jgi:DNA primase
LKGFIPEDKIAEVLHAADIVDVISEYVSLKKVGRNYSALCPFHSEKTPSFTVSAEKQIFHCFGCGFGGNVFSFLMHYHNISFPEAVRDLAKRYGIVIPTKRMSPEERKKFEERENILQINRLASKYFHDILLHASEGQNGRVYLKKRGISHEIIDRFTLGYADGSWNSLIQFFSEKKASLSLLEKAGLIIKKRGGYYDRFRARIIFPILDVRQNIIGFGGRVLDQSLPKYLNSPDTPVYNKSRSLYGIHIARSFCQATDSVFVVEGYFDLLALHCHSIQNAVATLGTALTREHIRILKGYARTAVLVFDSDEAGIKAAQRSLPLFSQEKMEVRILILPDGYDPDTFIFEHGQETFLKLAEKSLGVIPFLMSYLIAKHGLSIEGKVRIIDDMKISLATLADGVKRALYVKELAERLNIAESVVLEQVRKTTGTDHKKRIAEDQKTEIFEEYRIEKGILQMMVQFPPILPYIIKERIVEDFENPILKKIGERILKIFQDQGDIAVSAIVSCIDDPKHRSLITALFLDEQTWDRDKCFKGIERFRHDMQKRKGKILSRKIKEAQKANDQELLTNLLSEKVKNYKSLFSGDL